MPFVAKEITLDVDGSPVKVRQLRMGAMLELDAWIRANHKAGAGAPPGPTVGQRYKGLIDAIAGDGASLAGLPADVVEKHLKAAREMAFGQIAQMLRDGHDAALPGAAGPPDMLTIEWLDALQTPDGYRELAAVALPAANPGMARDQAVAAFCAMYPPQWQEMVAAAFGFDDEKAGDKADPKPQDAPAPAPPAAGG